MESSENNQRLDNLTRNLDLAKLTPPKRTERPVPRVYRHLIKLEHFRQFTLIERIKIVLGSNLVTLIGIATPHSPGEFQPLVIQRVSHQHTATDHMRNVVDQMIQERKPKTPIQHEPNDP